MEGLPESDRMEGSPHPREVFNLLGHADAETTFLKAKASKRLHHAWLITGPSGIGKSTLAYRMIRHLLGGRGQLGDLDVGEEDPVAGRIAAQGHGNLFVVRRPYDPKSKKLKAEIPVSEVRRLGEFFRETASEEGLPRIGLIDKADELNTNSENAVLKLLEEPPENGMLFLLADAPGRLLPTIRSRCLNLDLRPVPADLIKPWLSGRDGVMESDVDLAVALSRGAPGRALSLARSSDAVLQPLRRFAESVAKGGRGADLTLATSLSGAKAQNDRSLFWGALQDYLAAAAKAAAGGEWNLALPRPSVNADWISLHAEAIERETIERDINMEKRASMVDFLSGVRAA